MLYEQMRNSKLFEIWNNVETLYQEVANLFKPIFPSGVYQHLNETTTDQDGEIHMMMNYTISSSIDEPNEWRWNCFDHKLEPTAANVFYNQLTDSISILVTFNHIYVFQRQIPNNEIDPKLALKVELNRIRNKLEEMK